jgi:hypothetical protein
VRRCLFLLFALLLVVPACGGDDGDETPANAGAFGEADDCTQLVDQTLEARSEVLQELGDARRTDTERIDAALISFGEGPDLAQRYEGLGCGQDFDTAVCAALGDLHGAGPAGRDLVATWTDACAD